MASSRARTSLVKLVTQTVERGIRSGMTQQQKRSVGNLPVKSNKYVEDFGARRETIEKEFQWDGQTVRRIALWGVLAPYGIYRMMVYEFDSTDEFGSKPKRDLWGSSSS